MKKIYSIFAILLISYGYSNLQSMQSNQSFVNEMVAQYTNGKMTLDEFLTLVENGLLDYDDPCGFKLKEMRLTSYKGLNLYELTKDLIEKTKDTYLFNRQLDMSISTLAQLINGIISRRYEYHLQALQDGQAVMRPSSAPLSSFPLVLINDSSMNLEYKTRAIPATQLPQNIPVTFTNMPKTLSVRHIKENGSAGIWHPLFKHVFRIKKSKSSDEQKNMIIIKDTLPHSLKWNIETK